MNSDHFEYWIHWFPVSYFGSLYILSKQITPKLKLSFRTPKTHIDMFYCLFFTKFRQFSEFSDFYSSRFHTNPTTSRVLCLLDLSSYYSIRMWASLVNCPAALYIIIRVNGLHASLSVSCRRISTVTYILPPDYMFRICLYITKDSRAGTRKWN